MKTLRNLAIGDVVEMTVTTKWNTTVNLIKIVRITPKTVEYNNVFFDRSTIDDSAYYGEVKVPYYGNEKQFNVNTHYTQKTSKAKLTDLNPVKTVTWDYSL